MGREINLARQFVRPEWGFGDSPAHVRAARQVGVMALRAPLPTPRKEEQARSVEDVPVLTDEQLIVLATPVVEAEVELVEA